MLYKYSLAIVLTFMLSLTSGSAQNDFQAEKDSLLNVIATSQGKSKLSAYFDLNTILYYQEERIDSVIKYYEACEKEARRQGDIDYEGRARSNFIMLFRFRNLYEYVFKRAENDLAFLAKNKLWYIYYRTYQCIIEAYLYAGKSEIAFIEVNKMYDQARELKDTEGLATSMLQMGKIYVYLERPKEAEKCYKESLKIERQSKKVTNLRLDIYFYLSEVYSIFHKYDEAQAILNEWETDLIKYEEELKEGKKIALWKNLYLQYLQLYINKKEFDKIEPYCRLIEGMMIPDDETTATTGWLRSCALMAQKQYQKALEQSELCYEAALKIGNKQIASVVLCNKAKILAYLGRPDEAEVAFEQVIAEKDSLYNRQSNAQLDELRTQYEVDKHIAEKEKTRNYLLFALAVCLLLAIALGIWIYFNRKIVKKNHSLYRQIQALLQKEKETEQKLLNAPEEELSRDLLLFRQLSELIQKEKIFTEADLNRKKIADRLNTNEIYLADAIREVTGETLSTYISNLRLQYTLELLKEHPNMTFDTIAAESGHGSYSSFFRSFTKKYGITPSEYRKLATDDNNT